MYLKKIEITGFKSFYNKTVLFFPKPAGENHGMTAVVGPNGSGKSNICDALKWGLGIQSKKEVRSKKGDDVIFAGSETKKPLTSASVALHFDNVDHKFPLDYEEIVITRKIYAEKETEYFINDSQVRLLDIMQLLHQVGIGQQSYSIINQGMADRLLIANPLERKKIIEEAAKVKHFQIKKEKSEQKLTNTLINLEEVASLIEEIAPHLKNLERQAKRKAKQQALEQELQTKGREYFGILWHQLTESRQSQKKIQQIFLENLKTIEQEIEKIRAAVTESRTLAAKPIDLGNYQEKLSQLRKVENDFLRRFAGLEAKVNSIKEKIRLENTLNTWRVDIPYVQKKLNELLEEIEVLIKAPEESLPKEKFTGLKNIVEKLANEITKGVTKEINQTLIKELEIELSGNQNEIKKIEAEIQVIEQKRRALDKETAEKNQFNETEKQTLWRLEEKLNEKIENKEDLRNRINQTEIELAKLEVEEKNLRNRTILIMKVAPEALLYDGPYDLDLSNREIEIEKLARQIDFCSAIENSVVEEYEQTKERYEFLKKESNDLHQAVASLKKVIKELKEKIDHRFQDSFKEINKNFASYFKIIFGGGNGKLELTKDPADEINEESGEQQFGIDIKVTPPGKKIKDIAMLSGGEKALTSLALLFAIIGVTPPPFVVLDEVDAALDEGNSNRFAKLVKTMAARTQFIIITHNREVMKEAQVLYGVTMRQDGISKLLSVKLEEVNENLASS